MLVDVNDVATMTGILPAWPKYKVGKVLWGTLYKLVVLYKMFLSRYDFETQK